MRWQLICFFIFFCMACNGPSAKQDANIRIHLSADSQAVCVGGLAYAILHDLKQDSLSLQSWQAMLPVYRMPADTTMKDDQTQQPGTYQLTDSAIVFKPDTPFVKHQQYYVRFYGNGGSPLSSWKLIRSKANLKGPAYTEVVFNF
jgi:hypothetical protein